MIGDLSVEQGLLGLDDFVCKHVPEFAAPHAADNSYDTNVAASLWLKPRVTIRHLLTHTSGLPDACAENHELRSNFEPLSSFTAAMCRTPLLFEPGTNISYSSIGLNLLGEIVGRVSDTPLPNFLKTKIFEPLGLRDTQCGLPADRKKDREVALNLQLVRASWH
eukprot:SAG31_NODE_7618_length_1639_cov_0.986364_2_plen_164_part_00